ncbi:hypothetical protein EV121DRAFT_290271 [Schizophyllum commune]
MSDPFVQVTFEEETGQDVDEEAGFPHPFAHVDYEEPAPGTWAPRALVELRMYQLSATIREKPEWWRKFKDPEIRKKWFEEAKAQQAEVEERWRLTDKMINYTLGELEGYAQLRDEETGIEAGPYDRVWLSDRLIPDELRSALQAAIKPFEDVPEAEKDWHPNSNNQVLDLVHPSLYPLVYGKTQGKQKDGSIGTFSPPEPDEPLADHFLSDKFQWLPSDFKVKEDGTVALVSPYINNVPPENAKTLVPVLERIMARAVPLWERVLSDLRRGELPMRLGPFVENDYGIGAEKGLPCVWGENGMRWPEGDDEDLEGDALEAWDARQPLSLPDCPAEYDGALDERKGGLVELKGRKLQVIVKLANIVLTPEKPEYPGGKWHVEGMYNEGIVSTFIYYYHSENIQDTRLSFRQATAEPFYHEQDDSFCMKTLYGMSRDEPCVQDVGSVITKEGRCVAFPNLYQHKVSPFHLADPTKPGLRKILVFFLVDPTRNIPSATDIAPQQEGWLKNTLYTSGEGSHLAKVPIELLDVFASMTPGTMSREEAFRIREELMKERSVDLEFGNGMFTHEFNMCEH